MRGKPFTKDEIARLNALLETRLGLYEVADAMRSSCFLIEQYCKSAGKKVPFVRKERDFYRKKENEARYLRPEPARVPKRMPVSCAPKPAQFNFFGDDVGGDLARL